MIHFVGAGPGAPDLLTLRGAELLKNADCVIYAGSLVNPALLAMTKENCRILNSASMTLEQVLSAFREEEQAGGSTVRLHTGDPSVYGAIREQIDALEEEGIPYDVTPGVSSFSGAAAALSAEYTLPGVSQTVILTRMEGRTPVPEGEKLSELSKHGASMVLFLSAAIVYKATWPEEKVVRCTVGTLAESGRKAGITKTALLLVGDFLGEDYERSKLYDPGFTTGFRKGDK